MLALRLHQSTMLCTAVLQRVHWLSCFAPTTAACLLLQVWHIGGVLLLAAVIAAAVAVLAAGLVLPSLASEQVRK
jgi:hypothetical protein